MQALYGYFTTVESLKEVSRANLEELHALDPAKHDFSDKALFEQRKKQAVQLFNDNHSTENISSSDGIDEEVVVNVKNEIEDFKKKVTADARLRKKEMLAEADQIFGSYLKFLQLPIELEHVEKLVNEKKKTPTPTYFVDNNVVTALRASKELSDALKNYPASWNDQQNELRDWYREEILTSESLSDFFNGNADAEQFVTEVFKKVIFKSERIKLYLENQNLHWSENQPIVKSMVLKTLKSLTDNNEIVLSDLTKNGQEDLDFFEQIYDSVINQNDELDALISSKTENWDVERIAMTDLIIIKIALAEIMTCPSIPMKVSINEAIEISKQYSTPKSKQFVNGVLDVLSSELMDSGKIRKSGRGLIDNK